MSGQAPGPVDPWQVITDLTHALLHGGAADSRLRAIDVLSRNGISLGTLEAGFKSWQGAQVPRQAPELGARRTAAAAVLGDYTREANSADTADLALWAARMADMLRHVLAVLDEGDRAAAQFPAAAVQLVEIRLVLEAFDWETDDRQYALEQIDAIVDGDGR